jgi:formylglycine-generating enzyme required for sulfatase activity
MQRPYPFDFSDGRESASTAGLRILKGGGFADPGDLLDPAFRHAERPDRRMRWNGLRIARDVPAVIP